MAVRSLDPTGPRAGGCSLVGGERHLSPTFLAHCTILPSFMVEERAGIDTSAFTPAGTALAAGAAAGAAAAGAAAGNRGCQRLGEWRRVYGGDTRGGGGGRGSGEGGGAGNVFLGGSDEGNGGA